ncbi:3-amino-4-hydroxybenzoic acid synthase [Ruminiclostridium sufflavum DSM 19573]|uniref:3-amino-4-hydroxybenzoic acid synthase n=1 Tax=Ruminiclostridium sufflavum DSM 19573 TaxID=1121337 RepID=A0A318Y3T7_9FIRM|nr:3-dehydroquinate synthase II [Ruminiclostridium sufflavum]PYG90238.1 3-amino-4-hydroxybenzoic acid synthase [Ruminiclostridium sufflavum DSM 19573]
MKCEKSLWFEVSADTSADILDKVCQLEYNLLLVSSATASKLNEIKLPQRIRLGYAVSSVEELEHGKSCEELWGRVDFVIADSINLWEEIKNSTDVKAGLIIDVDDKEALDKAVELVKLHLDTAVIQFKDPTNIPLELILATTQKSRCRVIKKVKDARDGKVSLMTMEAGADGILLSSNDIGEIVEMGNVIQLSNKTKFKLQEAVVTGIKPAGMGTRVCIDTTSELTRDEGALLGSTSSGGLLTCSETHFLPYMKLRTFRVNAGGIHLYVWGPDDSAVYLSDLQAGDKIYVMNSAGEARTVTVGRLKIETRPLLQIECEIEGVKVNTFIQDDWHVRMFGSKGEIRPSSEIRTGDRLLGFLDKPGRHVGLKIDETIKEV